MAVSVAKKYLLGEEPCCLQRGITHAGGMMKNIRMDKLIEFGVEFMAKRGVSQDNARYISTVIADTEAFRQSTHGIAQFKTINDKLGNGINPRSEPKVITNNGSTGLLDGTGCFGIIAMKLAKELATKKSHEHGIGFVCVRNTEWIGAVGIHLISIVQEGLLAQVWAQTSGCKDCAPYGGIDARFSTNPIALAFPTGGNPVLADFSTATMSMSTAANMADKGELATIPRFLDNEGNPSNDPSVMRNGGTIMFAGCDVDGYKSYGLSLFNEALTVLAGGSANHPEVPSYQSFSLMVLDPSMFVGTGPFTKEIKRFIEHLKSSRVRPGFKKVRLPGERGFAALENCKLRGVPLDDNKLQILKEIADDNGMEIWFK